MRVQAATHILIKSKLRRNNFKPMLSRVSWALAQISCWKQGSITVPTIRVAANGGVSRGPGPPSETLPTF